MEGRDYISRLPDSILLHILDFLPTVDAVRTVCVPRFRYLWTSLPNLSFDQCVFHCCSDLGIDRMEFQPEFIDFVNSVLILHNCPTLDRFSLSMEFSFTGIGQETVNGDNRISPERGSNMIGLWIRFALQKNVRILNLCFCICRDDMETEDPESECYVLPSIVFRSRSLVELYLERCCIKLFGGIELKSLRLLWLTTVALSNEMVNQILSGCQFLEELSLDDCSGLDRLKILGPTSLKKLVIGTAYMDELDISLSGIKFLKLFADISNIICPTITHLDIDFLEIPMRFSDLPFMIEATLSHARYQMTHDNMENPVFRRLLQKLSNATSFKLCAFSIGKFPAWKLSNPPRPSLNWKCVTTVLGFANWIIPGLSRLLRTSPLLESLVIYVFPFHAAADDMSERKEAGDFDAKNYWGSVGGETFDCLNNRLKNVTIQGDITKPYIVDLIEFLLGNARVLENMVISTKKPPETYRNMYRRECYHMKNPIPPVSMVELSQLTCGFHVASARAAVFLT